LLIDAIGIGAFCIDATQEGQSLGLAATLPSRSASRCTWVAFFVRTTARRSCRFLVRLPQFSQPPLMRDVRDLAAWGFWSLRSSTSPPTRGAPGPH